MNVYFFLEYPKITWKPDSPFYAVVGTNDILEIKTNEDSKLKDIAWSKDGNPIAESKDYNFLGLYGHYYFSFVKFQMHAWTISSLKLKFLSPTFLVLL